jgi:phosphoglycolate phosphatase
MFKYILFDLDGTLTDSAEGISSSVMYALKKGGYPVGAQHDYEKFVGPPLTESLQRYYGLSLEEAKRILGFYRERYAEVGLLENKVYPGIPALLSDLKAAGRVLIIATSKPELFALRIMKYFDLDPYFDCIAGSDMEGRRADKATVIEYALNLCGIDHCASCVMVGDRYYDIVGAQQNGIPCIGVLYGYAIPGELKEAGASYLASNVEELRQLLLS